MSTQHTVPGVGFAVLYRWRLHPGHEAAFTAAWLLVSQALHSQRGSLGARLHRGSDGTWFSYAQWPSAQARSDAFALGSVNEAASEVMNQAIAERFPEITLEPAADCLMAPQSPTTAARRLGSDLQSTAWIVAKGIMFAGIAGVSATLLLLEWPSLKLALLLALLVWASCRFYYFLFYVLEHYVDPSMRYSGLLDLLTGMRRRRQNMASKG